MYQYIRLTDDMYWIGANDRRITLFENVFPVPKGISYNSYVVLDEKTVLLDTVDRAAADIFFENLEVLLGDRKLDYAVINHMEPDHCSQLKELVLRYPEVKLVCNKKTAVMIGQFFSDDVKARVMLVAEGDTLSSGCHNFTFVMAPMVHWPEVMVTYDSTDKILYSADAFGTFGALNGNIFADEMNFKTEWLPEARRYYSNIVGKYASQVQTLLGKAEKLDIALLCPLHGPVWRKDIAWFIEKYRLWSTYTPEENAVLIAYASVYGNTQNAAEILAGELPSLGVANIAMYDVSVTHPSYIVSEAFRCSHLVLASTTYNAGIFCNMETLICDLAAHNLQNRTVALIENGTWAPTAGTLMRGMLKNMKNITVLDGTVTLRSSVKPDKREEIINLARAIKESLPTVKIVHDKKIEPDAMFKLSYGLFVLTAREGGRDNGCIINTVMQLTDNPKRIIIGVNKSNYTHDMIVKSGEFNISVMTTEAPFGIFKDFGFRSGANTDKFKDFEEKSRSENGIFYIKKYTNSFISGKVISAEEYGTHTEFVAEVTEAKVLSSVPSVTYQYYFDNIKPKPAVQGKKKKGFVCKICGYVYEGDTLPADFVCPLCKHGAEDFEPLA